MKNKNLVRLCSRTVGNEPEQSTPSKVKGVRQMSGKHVVLAGIGAGAVATAFLAGSPTRVEEAELAFSHANEATFDQNGVLHAIGTSFGRLPHANPADSGLVTLVWSPDAANYYSLEGGHQTGSCTAGGLCHLCKRASRQERDNVVERQAWSMVRARPPVGACDAVALCVPQ